MSSDERPLLVVRHAPWEGPFRILDAFAGVPVVQVDVLDGDDPLPTPDEVRGAVLMGGPMSVNDTDEHPRLADELAWIRQAIDASLPLLGVCLGSQLIARALGAEVVAGSVQEIGFAPIDVLDDSDPLLRALAPSAQVLHWHGERYDLPPGAVHLARSAVTEVQAFRSGSAWGLLFHAEADHVLVERWLSEPVMADEAALAIGPDHAERLRDDAAAISTAAGDDLFAAFARICGV